MKTVAVAQLRAAYVLRVISEHHSHSLAYFGLNLMPMNPFSPLLSVIIWFNGCIWEDLSECELLFGLSIVIL